MIDTVRVGQLNNELGTLQENIERMTRRAGEILAELRTLLTEQPGQAATGADAAAADRAGTPAPASPELVPCPECQKPVKPMGLGTHRRQKHGRGRSTVLVRPDAMVATRRPAPAERNPRSAAPLELSGRLDRAAGE